MNVEKTAKRIEDCLKEYAEEWHVKAVDDEIQVSFMTEVRIKVNWDKDNESYYMRVRGEIHTGIVGVIADVCQRSESEYLLQKRLRS